ncbi:MAG: hypothetical protein IH897_11465 [Planctomycetes bacterium]|nr:hypothetical protein [Planctomycetota bacterium]
MPAVFEDQEVGHAQAGVRGGGPGSGGTPIKSRVDMLGVFDGPSPILDGIISVSEIAVIVDAFGGAIYPFKPSSDTLCGGGGG